MIASLERTVSRVETEYMAATKSANARVGYKDLMVMTNDIDKQLYEKNHPVRVMDNDGDFIDIELDVTGLKTKTVPSGIPFYVKDPNTLAGKRVAGNLLKAGTANNFYLPFSTITNCNYEESADPNVKPNAICDIENKNGANVITIYFTAYSNTNDEHKSLTAMLVNEFESNKMARRNFIMGEFSRVTRAAMNAKSVVTKINDAKKNDADLLAARKASIEKLIVQIAEMRQQMVTLESQKLALSQQVQLVKTAQAENHANKEKKITLRISIEKTIKTLESKINKQEILDKLTKDIQENKNSLRYWLTGSVYHRICTEQESNQLFDLALNDKDFDDKLNSHFFPQ
jgi:hypothetical protein